MMNGCNERTNDVATNQKKANEDGPIPAESTSVIRSNSTGELTPLATVPIGFGSASSGPSPTRANTDKSAGSSNMTVGGAFGVVGGLVDAIARDASSTTSKKNGKRPPMHRQSNSSRSASCNSNNPGNEGNGNHQSIAKSKVDFIAPADAVKSLFALPLANDVGVNIALHNIGNGTLLMDAAHDNVASYDEMNTDTADIGGASSQSNTSRRRRRRPRSASGENIFASRPSVMAAGTIEANTDTGTVSDDANSTLAIVSAALEQQRQQNASHSLLGGKFGQKAATKVQEFARSGSGTALLVAPSNALATTTRETEPPFLVEETLGHSTLANNAARSANVQDPISDMLPPPEHYVADVMDAPQRPRQYLDFKFHEMNLKVASDAVICRPTNVEGRDGSGSFDDSASNGPSPQGMAVRISDVQDLRAQMQHFQDMKRLEAASSSTSPQSSAAVDTFDNGKQKQIYPSYARALLSERASDVFEERAISDNQQEENTSPSPLHASTVPPTDIDAAMNKSGFIPAPPPRTGLQSAGVSPFTESSAPNVAVEPRPSSPVVTVLDAYLDNVMANVPQLALCLQDKGYVQSVKLLQTEDIPSSMMTPSTLNMDFDRPGGSSNCFDAGGEPLFSPQMVDMNASMLLRFLKANCSRENTTYLLRRGAGETNIQLYDITSLSSQRQKKWVWWLAMMSYRFAQRLSLMCADAVPDEDRAMKRNFRTRERSLLQNALDLLEDLEDMDGGKHETISAAIHEHLAGTFLMSDAIIDEDGYSGVDSDAKKPLPTTSRLQPYGMLTRDALGKAQDHLMWGIRKIQPVLDEKRRAEKERMSKRKNRRNKERIASPPRPTKGRVPSWYSSSSEDEDENDDDSMPMPFTPDIEALSIQLYGLMHKKVNVSLRLAEHHLRDYRSSSAMQELRSAARGITEIVSLLQPIGYLTEEYDTEGKPSQFLQSVRYQYAWLWEYCGHFARSFASDELWREKGHTSGEDIVSLLQEVQGAFSRLSSKGDAPEDGSLWIGSSQTKKDEAKSVLLTLKTQGVCSLRSPTPIVAAPSELDVSAGRKANAPSSLQLANSILQDQSLLKRERRLVLVAASICYGRAAAAFLAIGAPPTQQKHFEYDQAGRVRTAPTNMPSSSSAGQKARDSSILSLLRQRLGDSCNEVGQILLAEVKKIVETPFAQSESADDSDRFKATGPLLLSARFWFSESLRHFEASDDLRNIALLRCNLCQCCKIRANASIALPKLTEGDSKASHAEICLQQAADHLQKAHDRLGDRDVDPLTWDMVSTELAATLLVLGVRRRQSILGRATTPVIMQALRLNPGSERGIVKPIEQASRIYTELGNGHQAAAAQYQLALYYSKVWTCQRDETKTREKLSAAFKCFGAAHQYFFSAMRGNEPTFVILSLDFAGLFSSVSGQKESAEKALRCCIDTCDAFSSEAIYAASQRQRSGSTLNDDKEWYTKMCALGDAIEDKVLKLLQELVKLEKSDGGDTYKNKYRAALTAKMANKKAGSGTSSCFASDPASCSISVHSLLTQLQSMKN